jgi:hypothetical protein
MDDKKIIFQKKRHLGDIVSDTFLFLTKEFRVLSRIILYYVLPFFILYAVLQVNIQKKMVDSGLLIDPGNLIQNIRPFYGLFFLSVLFNVFVQSLYVAAVYSYIEAYINKGRVSVTDVTPSLFSNSLLALKAGILYTIIVLGGAMFCFLPGIYFANTFSLVFFILLFTKQGLGSAFRRSWSWVHAQWWNTLLLNVVALLMVFGAGYLLSLPATLAVTASDLSGLNQTAPVNYPQWYWVASGIQVVFSSLLYIVPYTFLAFHYFNLNERPDPGRNLPFGG